MQTLVAGTSGPIFIPFVPAPHVTALSAASHEPVIIIDTACQRTVAGTEWLRIREDTIKRETGFSVKREGQMQTFTFGEGVPTQSTECSVLPCSTNGHPFALRACAVPQPVPRLLSWPAVAKLGMILDTVSGTVRLTRIGGIELPLTTSRSGQGASRSPSGR